MKGTRRGTPPVGTRAANVFFWSLSLAVAVAATFAAATLAVKSLAAAPAPDASGPPERLLLLAPGQPLRIDLLPSIDGRPLRAAWRARLEELAADADRDHRGQFTVDQAVRLCEAAAGDFSSQLPRAQVRAAMAALAPAEAKPAQAEAKTGQIDRDAIFQYLARSAPPFVVVTDIPAGSAAAPALFGLIDVNQDGQLSRAELTGAAARLAVRDFDDDGLISERELILDPTQHSQRTTEEETLAQTRSKAAASLIWIGPDTSPASVAAAVLRRYDRDGDGKLLVAGGGESLEMTLAADVVQRLDANSDGRLDAAELEAIVAEPTDVVLPLSFGTGGQPATPSHNKSGRVRTRAKIDGGVKIYVDDTQIDINRNNRNPRQSSGLESRFARFDVDKSGYMDVKESNADPLIASAFEGMDADGDGHVLPSEFQAYVETQNASAAARVRLEVIDRGQDLFSVIDDNGDGLLTPRELADAAAIVDAEDRNGDGLLSGLEIPSRWSLDIARMSFGLVEARAARPRVRDKKLAAGEAGPMWFRKMDRNHDGDVSRGEFFGTAADFSAADTSGDGLIDPSEATALGAAR